MNLERVAVDQLKPHPRNYRQHGTAQLDHLVRSIEEHGFYRNVVIARDGTILAGHGVVEAAKRLQLVDLPVIRLDVDPGDLQALKVLIGDNQIAQGADVDDRRLIDMLKEIETSDLADLQGTGFDHQQLAALMMLARPPDGLTDEAAEWVGLPGMGDKAPQPFNVVVHCVTEADRAAFFAFVGATPSTIFGTLTTRSMWWPLRERVKEAPTFEG
jgi:hypothetical protein